MIYRLYSWRLEKKDNTPATTVELILSLVHVFQLLTLYTILISFFPSLHKKLHLTDWQVLSFAFAFQLLYHFFIYNKERWIQYNEEFKEESIILRRKGTFFMRLFIIGSILLFFICLPLFLGKVSNLPAGR